MRTKKALLNVLSGWMGQMFIIVFNLLSRKVFLNSLGELYLGLNGLLTNVVSFLSMAELGIGTAITFSLYKPLANNDTEELKSVMYFFKKVYWVIGSIIIIFGVILIPFLPLIVGQEYEIQGLPCIFLFFLFNTAITYFFSYKSTLIIADQKGYIFNINHYVWQLLMYIAQIISIVISGNYYCYLTVQFVTTLLEYLIISHIANKLYPFLKKHDMKPIPKEEKRVIFKNSTAMFLNKIGSTIVNSTDNILISTLISVSGVARFNNYSVLASAACGFMQKGITSTVSSVGNLAADGIGNQKKSIFEFYYMLCTWIFSYLVIGMYFLLPPFVSLFYGEQYVLDGSIIKSMCINSFLDGQMILLSVFISAMGLFWQLRYVGIIEAIINLIASIILGNLLGMVGIVLGTFLSKICFSFWIQIKIVLRDTLNIDIKHYVIALFRDSVMVGVICVFIDGCLPFLGTNKIVYLFETLILCIVVPSLCFYAIYRKTEAFGRLKFIFSSSILKR